MNMALLVGQLAFSMMPGADAVELMGALALGRDVTIQDFVYAGLSIGGGAVLLKAGAKFAKAAGRYAGKLGQRGGSWFRRNSKGLSLPVLQRVCFTAGTIVWTGAGAIPIEDVRVNDRVMSLPDSGTRVDLDAGAGPAATSLEATCPSVDLGPCCEVVLTIDRSHGDQTCATLLRPARWIELTQATVGGTIYIEMPEMGIKGDAQVVAIRPSRECEISSTPGVSSVTGTFATTNAAVVDLVLDGLGEPIGTTPAHPFWSLDRAGWVPAGELKPGERLRTLDGSVTVRAVTPRAGTQTVYNLEVHGDHTYFISDAKAWVHNSYVMDVSKSWVKRHGATHNLRNKHGFQLGDNLASRMIQNGIEPATAKVSISPDGDILVNGQFFDTVLNILFP